MKTQLSSLELHCLIRELQQLIDGKLDQIYMKEKEQILLQFHLPNQGKKLLKVIIGKFLFLTETKEEYEITDFCHYLRKHLHNTRLRSIEQKESERIIEFLFESKEQNYKLILEFIAPGNIILCNDQGIILSALTYHSYKDRVIRPKVQYQYPKKPINLFSLTEKELDAVLKNSQKESLVKALAVDLGLGGIYAEELCLLAKIDKNTNPKELDDRQLEKVYDSLILITKKEIKPAIIYKEEDIDVVPFELQFYQSYEKKSFKAFNEALDYYLAHEYREKKESQKERQIEKLKKIIQEQEKHIEELKKDAVSYEKIAETIYHKYNQIKELKEEILKETKSQSWQEVKEKFKNHKSIKEIDAKEKKITVSLDA